MTDAADAADVPAAASALASPLPGGSPEERGSRVEAAVAEVHHHHHPDDPNVGVVRVPLSRGAVVAAVASAAVTIAAVVLLALAIGGSR
jgi:hypothetical protein